VHAKFAIFGTGTQKVTFQLMDGDLHNFFGPNFVVEFKS
jgi:hypothetical protein